MACLVMGGFAVLYIVGGVFVVGCVFGMDCLLLLFKFGVVVINNVFCCRRCLPKL